MAKETERERLERIVRQAMSIQIFETEFMTCNSDDEPIEGTERTVCILFNLEKISAEEVERKIKDGSYEFDPRIIRLDPERTANLYPHRGEVKNTDHSVPYWKPCSYRNDYIHCECSVCEYTVEALQAVEIGKSSDDYVGVKFRYCPKCGSKMSHTGQPKMRPKLDVDKILYEGRKTSSEEATKGVVPVSWSEEVLAGECRDRAIIKEGNVDYDRMFKEATGESEA